jgi:hypothetical protein
MLTKYHIGILTHQMNHVYHRLESPTQTLNIALKQQMTGEIWGGVGRYSYFPTVRAYMGSLPPGARGIQFTCNLPPDPHPVYAYWRGNSPGLSIRGEYAVLPVSDVQIFYD